MVFFYLWSFGNGDLSYLTAVNQYMIQYKYEIIFGEL